MIIARYKRNNISDYQNIFEKIGIFIANQVLRLMADFKLYNIEANTFNVRIIAWLVIFMVPVMLMLGIVMAACIKFIFF
ncbi:MAG: hypothetical protein IKN15_02435 [Bacteroidaceae bacterium]|nr:hypothetical protein [Bacteroidaceae bacterium]